MEVTFVTSNRGKLREVRELLRPFGIRIRWSRQALPELQADDLVTVVKAKLNSARVVSGALLVEDSGLFIDALGGFPGVYSSYIYRIWKFGPILELLRRRKKSAVFRTVAGLRLGGRRWLFTGERRGSILSRPRGKGGFGFDPIFRPEGERRTYAELSWNGRKNDRSHRALAIRKVGRFLRDTDHASTRAPAIGAKVRALS